MHGGPQSIPLASAFAGFSSPGEKGMMSKRSIASSLFLGVLSVALTLFAVQFSASPPSVPLHCCFLPPVLAAMAYGWRGGLIAGFPWGVAYHFILFPANGWANVAATAYFLTWYAMIGWASSERGRKPGFWNSPHFVLLASMGVLYFLFTQLFPFAYRFNPAPWNGAAWFSSRPHEVLHAIAIKEAVQVAIVLSLSNALLLCHSVRRLLGLELRPEARENGRVVLLSVSGGLALWVVLMVIEHALLREPVPSLVVDLKLHETLALLVILAGSLISGAQICGYMERRLASEDALRMNERNYREIFDSSIDALFIHDLDGRIVDVNGRMLSMFGYTRAEALLLSVEDVSLGQPPYSNVEAMALIRKAFSEGPQFFEWRVKRRNGEVFWSDVALRSCSIGGQPRVIASVRDIDYRKSLEEQLAQAQKLESIGRLAGGIAHDFNNHLTVMIGCVDLVCQRRGLDDYARRHLKEASKAAHRAGTLTKQLLAFSRRELINPELLDLNEVAEDLKRMLARLIGEDLQLKASLSPGMELVMADRGQLEQIIMNLSVNARDAMPEGGVLEISTAMEEADASRCERVPGLAPGRYAVLSVSDTGCGISEDVKQRMFEPFFTTKPVGKGTGLGLSIVYGAVKQNQGCIEVASELGKGTTFKIYFPPAPAQESVESGEAAASEAASRGAETVLLAEDDSVIRSYVMEVLEGLGYRVIPFADGASAAKWAESFEGRVDMLLSDVVMPGMNGRELAAKVLALKPGAKILFMSGYAEDVIATHGVLEKGVHLIAKPFTIDAISSKIRSVLDGR